MPPMPPSNSMETVILDVPNLIILALGVFGAIKSLIEVLPPTVPYDSLPPDSEDEE